MQKKIILLDLAFEFLNETKKEPNDKKKTSFENKQIRDLRDRYPIQISITFKIPWWSSPDS